MRTLTVLLSLFLFTSCVSNRISTEEVVSRENAKIEETNKFEFVKFWMELDIFRYKYNIAKVNFGIIIENYEDNDGYQYPQALADRSYKFIVETINEMNNNFETSKIDYFSYSNGDKVQYYNNVKFTPNAPEHINSAYFEQYKDLQKRLRYYCSVSNFFTSQSTFENYLKERSYIVVDRSVLTNILGEYGLSLTGLTKDQAEQLKLYNINFLIVASGRHNARYESEIRDYIAYNILDLKLIYSPTSEIVTTARLVEYK